MSNLSGNQVMSHVFISYSSQDKGYAQQLTTKLRSEGFEVWIDKSRLRTSEDWWHSIVEALQKCSAVIVILTPQSDASEYVQDEITLARRYKKPRFPLWLDGSTDTTNWTTFVRTQIEDVRGGKLPPDDFYDKLAEYTPRRRRRGAKVRSTDKSANVEIVNTPPLIPEKTSVPVQPVTEKVPPTTVKPVDRMQNSSRRQKVSQVDEQPTKVAPKKKPKSQSKKKGTSQRQTGASTSKGSSTAKPSASTPFQLPELNYFSLFSTDQKDIEILHDAAAWLDDDEIQKAIAQGINVSHDQIESRINRQLVFDVQRTKPEKPTTYDSDTSTVDLEIPEWMLEPHGELESMPDWLQALADTPKAKITPEVPDWLMNKVSAEVTNPPAQDEIQVAGNIPNSDPIPDNKVSGWFKRLFGIGQ